MKQLLLGELVHKSRHKVWKKEKWEKKAYQFAPWEREANEFSDKAYTKFMRQEITRVMKDERVHAYHPAVVNFYRMFPREDVLPLAHAAQKERLKQKLLSSGKDWLLVGNIPNQDENKTFEKATVE